MVTEFGTALRRWMPRAAFRRLRQAGYWFDPRDIPLFLRGAATDARIDRLRYQDGNRSAFETIYREQSDPWASVATRYRYQSGKYDVVVGLLPPGRRFAKALDLGFCNPVTHWRPFYLTTFLDKVPALSDR